MSDAFVLDASALLCLLHDEKGADRVSEALPRSIISAVNLSEAIAKLADVGLSRRAHRRSDWKRFSSRSFRSMKNKLRLPGCFGRRPNALGLSFGDRACLALGRMRKAVVLTCDNAWSSLDLGVAVEQLR